MEKTMTVQDVRENLEKYSNEERAEPLGKLIKVLSGVSHSTLLQFQQTWDDSRPFDDFRKAQDAEIAKCIDLEVSDFGKTARSAIGLDPLELTTILA